MKNKVYNYDIAGTLYTQRPLVLGQLSQIIGVLKDIKIPSNINEFGIIALLGDNLSEALAVILSKPGTSLKDKDLAEEAEFFRENIDIATAIEIIENFFVLNPIVSVSGKLTGIMNAMKRRTVQTGSNEQSSSSPEETSQSETASSGDTRSGNADPFSKTGEDGQSSGKLS